MSILKTTKTGTCATPFTLDDALKYQWRWYVHSTTLYKKINDTECYVEVVYDHYPHEGNIHYEFELFQGVKYIFYIKTYEDYFLLIRYLRANDETTKNKLKIEIVENENTEMFSLIDDSLLQVPGGLKQLEEMRKERQESRKIAKQEHLRLFKIYCGLK